jgi:hypothetical protein
MHSLTDMNRLIIADLRAETGLIANKLVQTRKLPYYRLVCLRYTSSHYQVHTLHPLHPLPGKGSWQQILEIDYILDACLQVFPFFRLFALPT